MKITSSKKSKILTSQKTLKNLFTKKKKKKSKFYHHKNQ